VVETCPERESGDDAGDADDGSGDRWAHRHRRSTATGLEGHGDTEAGNR